MAEMLSRLAAPAAARTIVVPRTAVPAVARSVLRLPRSSSAQIRGFISSGTPVLFSAQASALRAPEAQKDAHIDHVPAHGDEGLRPSVRRLEDAPDEVQKFSDVSNADMVRSICHSKVPGWENFMPERILIDQLCEGLSNQNFKVHLDLHDLPEEEFLKHIPCVLFRVYGTGADKLYDPDLEVKIVLMLSKYGIGPSIYAKDTSWRIEGWHYSVPLPNRSMRNPAIWAQMAAHMGRLHKLGARPDFPDEIRCHAPLSMGRLSSWATACQETADGFDDNMRAGLPAEMIREMLNERAWLKDFLIADDPHIEGSGLDVVFSHWDTQENNVLQTLYGLRFIDFEYAGMEYQAFDIASYFVECTIDYLVSSYPFYKVTLSDLPTEQEMKTFCAIYLSEYLEAKVLPNDLAAEVLSERVQRFTLATHLLWSMWSVIRAGQAGQTFGGFDYLHYSNSRWFMYKWTKRALLHKFKV